MRTTPRGNFLRGTQFPRILQACWRIYQFRRSLQEVSRLLKWSFPSNSQNRNIAWWNITQQVNNRVEDIHWAYITPLHMPLGWSMSTPIQTRLANDFSLLLKKRTRVLNLGILAKLSIYSWMIALTRESPFVTSSVARKVSMMDTSMEGSREVLHNAGKWAGGILCERR